MILSKDIMMTHIVVAIFSNDIAMTHIGVVISSKDIATGAKLLLYLIRILQHHMSYCHN